MSSDVIDSTEPDFGGGIDVATGPTCAMRRGSVIGGTRVIRTHHVEEPRQHAPGVEILVRDLDGTPRVTA